MSCEMLRSLLALLTVTEVCVDTAGLCIVADSPSHKKQCVKTALLQQLWSVKALKTCQIVNAFMSTISWVGCGSCSSCEQYEDGKICKCIWNMPWLAVNGKD